MSRNLSDKETTKDTKRAPRNEDLKFVSDEDIVGRSKETKPRTPFERKGKGPIFVSDEDIVNKRVA
jgi:hypothetical protein